jgi:RimJ/RimL family protein N-acetyltransferase
METIETARLVLRRPIASDLEPLVSINADPEVMRHIADGRTRTREQTEAGLERAMTEWRECEFGMFSVELAETGKYIGWVALAIPAFLPEVLPAVEIGWRLDRGQWGHGYATEAAQAVLRYGFEDCALERIVSIRDVANEASRRVMEKLGLRFAFETTVPTHGQRVAVHALIREKFDAQRTAKTRSPGAAAA